MQKIHSFFSLLLPSVNGVSRSWNQYLEAVGLAGLCIYVFAFPFSKDICYIGEWMMVGAFIISVPHFWPRMKHDPVFIGFLVLLVYLVFKGASTFFFYKEPVADIADAVRFRLRFLWIFIIAWWLGGTRTSLLRLLGISLFGFLVLLATGFETRLLEAFERGLRTGFGLNPQHFALYSATALSGCLILAGDFWGTRYRYFRIFLWLILVLVLFELVIFSQTRTIWMALILVLFFSGTAGVIYAAKHGHLRRRRQKIYLFSGCSIVMFLIILGVHFHSDTINKRVASEFAVLEQLFSSGKTDIKADSLLGKRAFLWEWSLAKISKRPLTGWKIDDTSKDYISQSREIHDSASHFHHVHNSYLEVILNQGLIGLFVFLFFPVYVVCSVAMHFKKGRIPLRFFMFFCSFVIISAVANISEAYITSWLFWPYLTMFLGGFYSFVLWDGASAKEGSV